MTTLFSQDLVVIATRLVTFFTLRVVNNRWFTTDSDVNVWQIRLDLMRAPRVLNIARGALGVLNIANTHSKMLFANQCSRDRHFWITHFGNQDGITLIPNPPHV